MMDLANYSATETLRDGRTVEIRAQRSQDREGMQAAIARSGQARKRRWREAWSYGFGGKPANRSAIT